MAKRKQRRVTVEKGDLQIARIAKQLGRSYSWVYVRLAELGKENVFKYKGVIFIRPAGFDKLAIMSAKAPKRGRPRAAVAF